MNALLAQPGTQYAPRLASELHLRGALGRFATGLTLPEGRILGRLERLAPASWRRRWANRRVPGVPSERLYTFSSIELRAFWRLSRGEPAETVLHARNAAFQKAIPNRWMEEATHVIGFDTSSWLLAERC